MSILVILESPAKCKKIGDILKSLGHDVVVKASYGHVSDLDKKKLSIDVSNQFKPNYIINRDKSQVISELKIHAKRCSQVLLGCDFDREGEAIAWHLSEQLKIPKDKRKRLLFTEITKTALKKAIENTVDLDMDMFYAQQARRIIDRLIGYKITPLLWSNIQNSMKKDISLSAGRVQSVVNRLIIEREEEINNFNTSSYYKTTSKFRFDNDKHKINAELVQRITDKEKAYNLLEICANASFKVGDVKKTISKRNPSPPFITSTIQQEVSSKFRISPKRLMMILQKLYENGLITYMRTDSTLLSDDILNNIEKMVIEKHGEKYSTKKQYSPKSKNSQEAHEAIRPTDINLNKLEDHGGDFTMDDYKVYNLIWRRTIASQMSPAKLENITIVIDIYDDDEKLKDYYFTSKNQKVLFDGFTIIYKPYEVGDNCDDDVNDDMVKQNILLKDIKQGLELNMKSVYAVEKYTKPSHLRYTEASLIKKLDELGIGRPSTYSSMVTVVQDRKYVELKDKEGETKKYNILKLMGDTIEETEDKVKINGEKNKLIPTNIGIIVNKFLCTNFENILNSSFTAKLEANLDLISTGKKNWVNVVKEVYNSFNEIVVKLGSSDATLLDKNKYRRVIGIDPTTNFEICTYIAKYGPVIQLKNTTDAKKCKFAPLKDIKMEEVTLEQAIALLKYPYVWGKYNKKDVQVCKGKFGIYLKYNDKNISMNGVKEENINSETIKNLLLANSNGGASANGGAGAGAGANATTTSSNIIKTINKDIIIKTGQYGPYINYKNKHNIKIYSKKPIDELNVDDCMLMIQKKFKKK